MEKRDLIVIIVAIVIVLVMAMYIKPLVTGKEVKIIPDELSSLFSGKNETYIRNETTIPENQTEITGVVPDSLVENKTEPRVVLEGTNLSDSIRIHFSNNNTTMSYQPVFENETLFIHNVTLPAGEWNIQVENITSRSKRNSSVILLSASPSPTPVPTWNGTPMAMEFEPTVQTNYGYPSRPYPTDIESETVNFSNYILFGGVSSGESSPIEIPYPYWILNYTISYRPNLAIPQNERGWEFNKQYKEFMNDVEKKEITPVYDQNGMITGYTYEIEEDDLKINNEIDITLTKPSKDTVLVKVPDPEEDAPYFTQEEEGFKPELGESTTFGTPSFRIIIRDQEDPSKIQVVSPPGGIDPLGWDMDLHRKEAEKLFKETDQSERFDSDYYQDYLEGFYDGYKDPRPWTEKIFGSGKFTFEIQANNIDSYNIAIQVPDKLRTTQKHIESPHYLSQKDAVSVLFDLFISEFNELPGDPGYMEELRGSFSGEILTQTPVNEIISKYRLARSSGISITTNSAFDTYIRGTTGIVQGTMEIERGGFTKTLPMTIGFIREGNAWKFEELPEIRF